MGELLIGCIKSKENIADVMTKVLPNGAKRDSLIQGGIFVNRFWVSNGFPSRNFLYK
jgi:hypothetical protein